MAILTLFHPEEWRGKRRALGNYIDLRTELVSVFDLRQVDPTVEDSPLMTPISDQLVKPAENSPGAILVGGTDSAPTVRVCVIHKVPISEHLTGQEFGRHRLAFDRMIFENVGHKNPLTNHPVAEQAVNELDYGTRRRKLAPLNLGVGSRFIVRFHDPAHPAEWRFFKFLVHPFVDRNGTRYKAAFRDKVTALQFEELIPGRVIVPLGIGSECGRTSIVTSENIPAHFINKRATSLMWSLRPRESTFVADSMYERPFPIAKVVFRTGWNIEVDTEAEQEVEDLESGPHYFQPHPPPWVGWTKQRNMMSRSYMNSTYSIGINHAERPEEETGISKTRKDPFTSRNPVSTHRYKYDLYMVDGMALKFDKYDPPVDVEDQD